MIYCKFFVIVAVVVIDLTVIDAHGMLMDPVNRGSAFKKGFKTPRNWDDAGNFCGGYSNHFLKNKGKCGACGDDYSNKQPRANENGGTYGTGTIVRTYTAGQEIEVTVKLVFNHGGYFEFALCPLRHAKDIETEECFDEHPLRLVDGSDRYHLVNRKTGNYVVQLVLPKSLTCEHCSLRWNYRVANAWGLCEDKSEDMGCGNQEIFRTCSDITIISP